MEFLGTSEQLIEIVQGIAPVDLIEELNPTHIRIRTRYKVVVNWLEKNSGLIFKARLNRFPILRGSC